DRHFSPDGKTIVTFAEDNVIRMWDAGTGELKKSIPNRTEATVEFSPDGKELLLIEAGLFHLLSAADGSLIRSQRLKAPFSGLFQVQFFPDGKGILVIEGSIARVESRQGADVLGEVRLPSEIYGASISPRGDAVLLTTFGDDTG